VLGFMKHAENDLMDIFFAFPDGVFHHVCAECTALCCRGQGFAGSLKREMNFVFRNYPPLASLVTEREGDIVTVATPTGQGFACCFRSMTSQGSATRSSSRRTSCALFG
jgi:hypothetical protein